MSFPAISNNPYLNQIFFFKNEKNHLPFGQNHKVIAPNNSHFKINKTDFSLIIQKLKNPKDYFQAEQEIAQFIDQIAQVDFDNASENEIEIIIDLLIEYARKGVKDQNEQKLLEKDIQDLLSEENSFSSQVSQKSSSKSSYESLCFKKSNKPGFFKKNGKKLVNFVKKHKKAIIITTVVVAAVAVAAVVTIAAVNTIGMAALAEGVAATGTAIGAAAAASQPKNEWQEDVPTQLAPSPQHPLDSVPPQNNDNPQIIQPPLREISPLEDHENISIEHHLPHIPQGDTLGCYDQDFKERFQSFAEEADLEPNPFTAQSEQPFSQEYYENKIEELERRFALNPERNVLASNIAQNPDPIATPIPVPGAFEVTKDFCKGYTEGIIQGVKDSGSGWKYLATEFVKHPLDTTDQVINAFRDLSNLVLTDQWGELSEALSPEGYKLATEWNSLSADERGLLAGYAIGKGGTDIFIPGAAAKLASKGLKGANKLLNISNSLQKVEGALALEGAAIERGVKISEAIMANHEIVQAAEKLGLNAQGALNLKQALKLTNSSHIIYLEKQISELLGEGVRAIKNEVGDPIFLSKDGLRCVRFDFNKTVPHNNVHAHVELKVNGKWIKSGPIYPIDVPHN